MELPLKERFARTRENLRHTFDETSETLKHRRDELKHRVEHGRGRVAQAEATVLEAAADGLAKARQALGERAAFVERSEKALREALVELRAGHAATLPIPNYDELNVREANAAFIPLHLADLRTVRAYELKHKKRVTVLKELDARIARGETS
ncbi:hypothetical protein LBMAG42_17890 [Deltaproteobacteria bacterium]|nr:hypothetical protein LBMAG42_17890 [Deltaproteobacteria bacterium]